MATIKAVAHPYVVAGTVGTLAVGLLSWWRVSQNIRRPDVPDRMSVVDFTKSIQGLKNNDEIKSVCVVNEVEVPTPGYGEVLVRVERSPINPSDLMSLVGVYGGEIPSKAKFPRRGGHEGSGQVVASGGGLRAWYLLGKRVACIVRGDAGMWGQYVCVPASLCFVLPDDVTYEEGCSSFVNPLTALAFVQICRRNGLNSMVHTAALSALGKMLLRLCLREGIELVCVVHKTEQMNELIRLGARHVLLSTDKEFVPRLRGITTQLDCRLAFDAVAGELAGQILAAMPNKSQVFVYGGLSQENIRGVGIADLVFFDKHLSGFWVGPYLNSIGIRDRLSLLRRAQKLIKTDLRTTYGATYTLKDVHLALFVLLNGMATGKIVVAPNS